MYVISILSYYENYIQLINKDNIYLLLFIILFFFFSTNHIIIFYIFFEFTLIPLFFLIGIYGYRTEKIKASFYFFFYTFACSIIMLSTLMIQFFLTNTFIISQYNQIEVPFLWQCVIMAGFSLGMFVKLPLIPFHLWLPQAHVEAPLTGSIILAGILLKAGSFGIIKIILPNFKLTCYYYLPFILLLCLISVLYGALCTIRQNDIKRLIAYSSISHMGLLTLSMYTFNLYGFLGGYIVIFSHAFTSSCYFLLAGIIYKKTHTRVIKYITGINTIMPILTYFCFIITLSNTCFPVFINFTGEYLCIIGISLMNIIILTLIIITILLCSIYSFYLFNRLFYGLLSPNIYFIRDISYKEIFVFFTFCNFSLFLGVYLNYFNYLKHIYLYFIL